MSSNLKKRFESCHTTAVSARYSYPPEAFFVIGSLKFNLTVRKQYASSVSASFGAIALCFSLFYPVIFHYLSAQ